MNLFHCCCMMAPNTRITRKWELFAGRNRFYCDGLLMSAPHTGVFYLTCFLITGTSALFFAFDCPYLATRITPAIPIVGALLYFFTMSSLLRTTFTDPGVIPRASYDEAAYIERQIEVPNSLNSPTYRPPPRTKEVLVKGQTVKLKYCFTCKIFRPPRASHCSLCDNCVDRFDHHCPWVGNCVGKRNYRFFYMFLVSLAFLAVFIFSCSITHLVLLMKVEQEVFEVIKKAPFSVIVTFICFFSIWSVIGLAGFHTYLTTSDQTTNEDLKGSFSSKGGQRSVNPYSRGNICLNCFHILCGPMTPSLIDRRGVVTDEYVLQMQHNNQNNNQNNQLTNVVTSNTPSPLITSQPVIGSLDPISTKPRLYDDAIPSAGIYRHRSYDNLQNGNSNSLAQLVDNEIPLSTIEGPVALGDGCDITPTTTDEDNIEAIKKRLNNLSGSYNNLFRDSLDTTYNEQQDDLELKQKLTPTSTSTTTGIGSGQSSIGTVIATGAMPFGVIPNQNQSTTICDFRTLGESMRMNKSASESENVYSNIPTSNLSSSAISSCGSNRSDPNLHVYSNLIEEKQNQQQQQHHHHHQRQSLPESILPTNIPLDVTNIIKPIKINSIKRMAPSAKSDDGVTDPSNTILPSALIDDLDLDDPIGAFAMNNRKRYETSSRKESRKKSWSDGKDSPSTPLVGVDVKLVSELSPSELVASSVTSTTTGSSSAVGISSPAAAVMSPSSSSTPKDPNSSSNFITPGRMKHLHDTTMIDTALDLDSLDGSSIGNNSQACLVKTAIV